MGGNGMPRGGAGAISQREPPGGGQPQQTGRPSFTQYGPQVIDQFQISYSLFTH